jgi:hypothetical protein
MIFPSRVMSRVAGRAHQVFDNCSGLIFLRQEVAFGLPKNDFSDVGEMHHGVPSVDRVHDSTDSPWASSIN